MSGDITRVEKPWGYELHWAKTDRYVGKIIHVNAGHALSLPDEQEWQVNCQQGHAEERHDAGEPADRVSKAHDPEITIAHVADLVRNHTGELAQRKVSQQTVG